MLSRKVVVSGTAQEVVCKECANNEPNLQFMKTDCCSFFVCTFVGKVGVGVKRKEKKPKGRGVGRVGEWSVHVCWEDGRK